MDCASDAVEQHTTTTRGEKECLPSKRLRFGGCARLGAALSVLVVLVGKLLVMWTWPLHR